ncbi:unnamed protein product [Heligmosomoides polygyrus]|uniref:SWIM-type domain-containing protein n=1 Tax=Heligmosomoides polygyrus TaxID=6339 RepID=A0A183F634_HELPZ|nr:unnamed protein product [Heligmosomoides polygyrus]
MTNIAKEYLVQPGRLHDDDTTSLEMRINKAERADGIRYYSPAHSDTGDGFVLVVLNPTQEQWLKKYGKRVLCIDDTFDLTAYKLRLSTVIVVDEWDRALPCAYLLSHRMTQHEVAMLFEEVYAVLPTFDTDYLMSDDTNTFWNGFKTMERGLEEGRFRLREQHKAHELARKKFDDKLECVVAVDKGTWNVFDGDTIHTVRESVCPCDSRFNNHCKRDMCGACSYSLTCDCRYDIKSGVSCAHVHAAVLYASSSRIRLMSTTKTNEHGEACFFIDRIGNAEEERATSPGPLCIGQSKHNQGGMDSESLALNDANTEIGAGSTEVCILDANRDHLQRLDAKAQLKKRDVRTDQASVQLPKYQKDDVPFCSLCFRMQPQDGGESVTVDWIQCCSCENWMHVACLNGSETCPHDETPL